MMWNGLVIKSSTTNIVLGFYKVMRKEKHNVSANQNFPLLQKKVAATGKLRKYTRKTLMAILKERGAYPTCYVSRRTDFLIVGERPGIKLERAITLGVCIIPGQEFESMLAQFEQHNQDGA